MKSAQPPPNTFPRGLFIRTLKNTWLKVAAFSKTGMEVNNTSIELDSDFNRNDGIPI
jgi:hypothetical protein